MNQHYLNQPLNLAAAAGDLGLNHCMNMKQDTYLRFHLQQLLKLSMML